MPRKAVYATSDGGAVLGENGEIAEWWYRRHRLHHVSWHSALLGALALSWIKRAACRKFDRRAAASSISGD